MANLRNLTIIDNFLSTDELELWKPLLQDPSSWSERHPIAGNGQHMGDTSKVYQEPWAGDYLSFVTKVRDQLEQIYEEPLVTQSGAAFRKYSQGDYIGMHYDFARDGEGKVLQLRDETRRPGEMAHYPAGLHDIQSVVYLNDDFTGGYVRFGPEMYYGDAIPPNTPGWITPKPGMLITWPSTHRYGHSVSRVMSGERYISAMFWIRAKTFAIATHTDLISPDWKNYLLWPERVEQMLGIDLHSVE